MQRRVNVEGQICSVDEKPVEELVCIKKIPKILNANEKPIKVQRTGKYDEFKF